MDSCSEASSFQEHPRHSRSKEFFSQARVIQQENVINKLQSQCQVLQKRINELLRDRETTETELARNYKLFEDHEEELKREMNLVKNHFLEKEKELTSLNIQFTDALTALSAAKANESRLRLEIEELERAKSSLQAEIVSKTSKWEEEQLAFQRQIRDKDQTLEELKADFAQSIARLSESIRTEETEKLQQLQRKATEVRVSFGMSNEAHSSSLEMLKLANDELSHENRALRDELRSIKAQGKWTSEVVQNGSEDSSNKVKDKGPNEVDGAELDETDEVYGKSDKENVDRNSSNNSVHTVGEKKLNAVNNVLHGHDATDTVHGTVSKRKRSEGDVGLNRADHSPEQLIQELERTLESVRQELRVRTRQLQDCRNKIANQPKFNIVDVKGSNFESEIGSRLKLCELLEAENTDLLNELKGQNVDSVPRTSLDVAKEESAVLRQKLADKQKLQARTEDAMQIKLYETHVAMIDILGWKLNARANRHCTVQSAYNLGEADESLDIVYDSKRRRYSSIVLSSTVKKYQSEYDKWVCQERCIPAFLASVFLKKVSEYGIPPPRPQVCSTFDEENSTSDTKTMEI